MTLLVWVVWGYKMGFGKHMIPGLVGIPGPVLSSHTELQQVSIQMPQHDDNRLWGRRCLEEQ